MKNIFFSLSLIISHILVSGQDQKLSLLQCVETGITNNLQVQQSGLQVQSSEIYWKQAKLNLLPNLNGSISHGINQGKSINPYTNSYINQNITTGSYNLTGGVVLFNGFSLLNSVKQTSLAYQASKMDWQQAKDNITINIILAYLQVLSNGEQLQQAKNQLELSKQQVDRLELLNQKGAINPSDLSDLKGQYSGDRLSIINAQNAMESSKLTLCQLMNIPYNKNMELEMISTESLATKYEDTPDKIYTTALTQLALIRSADLHELSAEKGLKVAKAAFYPTLSFGANTNTNYSSAASQETLINTSTVASNNYVIVNNTQYPVMTQVNNYGSQKINYGKQLSNNRFTSFDLSLRIPIFNSLQARNQVKQSQLILKNTRIIASATRTQLQQNIEQAYINMTSASDSYKTLLDQVSAYSESFRIAEVRFNSGLGTPIDYLTAKNNMDRANINLINAKYDYVLRTKILDYYQGKPLW
ncbi:MAG: TolC family protein [Chitinophagaceae bacterium]|jgi:outer membrane protein|nr:TolC family protein [Chitinophagaceae bacterium]OQY93368.1 MAG: transporter [Sphingobacteriales bacterium UTBCD1]